MKGKIILAVVLMACCISQIDAQIHFGIKGGLNYDQSKLENVKAPQLSLENALGWQAGVLLQFKVPVVGVAVQPELLYTASNANINDKANCIHYFEIPIMLQLGPDFKVVRPYVQGGPYFGFSIKSEGDPFKNNIDKNDWGMALGVGIDIWKFQLSARYQWGLKNVSTIDDFELKNNRLNLLLGFLF